MDHPSPEAMQRAALESRFVASLGEIERVSRFVARRHRLSPSEADDFCSEVNLAIIQDNYAVLAAFEGRCSLRTYLTTVIQRLFLDHRRRLWGKWRPSAEARRGGPLALRLEVLLFREGLSFEEAVETMQTNLACDENRETLAGLAHRLPQRANRRAMVEGVEDLATIPASDLASPESQVQGTITSALTQGAVDTIMGGLDPRDRLVLRMRFEDDIPVARIARTLHLDQKHLYRRIESLLVKFRKSFVDRGLSWPEVTQMIDRGQCHLRLPPLASAENADMRPSLQEVQA